MGCLMFVALSVIVVYMSVFVTAMLANLVAFGSTVALYMSVFVGYFVAFFFILFM